MRFSVMCAAVLWLLLVVFVGAAQAAPVVRVRAETEDHVIIDVSATTAETSPDAEKSIEWATRELEAAQNTTPGLRAEVALAEPAPDGSPKVTALKADRQTLRQTVARLFATHYRVSFTVVRGLANTGVVSWGLILSSHVSALSALPVGLVAGGMSAGFQYFNKGYQDWLLRSKTPVGRMGRSFLVNIGYLGVAKLTAAAAGITQNPSLVDATRTVLQTAFLGTLAQGTWNLGIAENARIAAERHPERAPAIRRMNDFKTLALSMVSTALSVANLVGAPFTEAGMFFMTGTGTVYYAWSMIRARRWAKEKLVRETQTKLCASELVP